MEVVEEVATMVALLAAILAAIKVEEQAALATLVVASPRPLLSLHQARLVLLQVKHPYTTASTPST